MKIRDFNLDEIYTFNITIYPNDKTEYAFQDGESNHTISGLLLANNKRLALVKLYEQLGVEYGKTICSPYVRHFITEELPFMNKDELFCTGFVTR
jgi:hypothetical protein